MATHVGIADTRPVVPPGQQWPNCDNRILDIDNWPNIVFNNNPLLARLFCQYSASSIGPLVAKRQGQHWNYSFAKYQLLGW